MSNVMDVLLITNRHGDQRRLGNTRYTLMAIVQCCVIITLGSRDSYRIYLFKCFQAGLRLLGSRVSPHGSGQLGPHRLKSAALPGQLGQDGVKSSGLAGQLGQDGVKSAGLAGQLGQDGVKSPGLAGQLGQDGIKSAGLAGQGSNQLIWLVS